MGEDQVSRGVSVICCHVTPIADVLWEPLVIWYKDHTRCKGRRHWLLRVLVLTSGMQDSMSGLCGILKLVTWIGYQLLCISHPRLVNCVEIFMTLMRPWHILITKIAVKHFTDSIIVWKLNMLHDASEYHENGLILRRINHFRIRFN